MKKDKIELFHFVCIKCGKEIWLPEHATAKCNKHGYMVKEEK